MPFDPDAFLAEPEQAEGFNPDAFLQAEPVKQPAQPELDEPFPGASILEPTMAISSGIGSTIAGGVAGLSQALNPFGEEGSAAETVKSIQEAGTYQPKTEGGKATLKTLGDLVQKGVDIVNYPISGIGGLMELISGQGVDKAAQTIKDIQNMGVSKTFGERTFEETGSSLAATIAEVTPEAVMGVAGFKPGVKAVESVAQGAKTTGKVGKTGVKTLFSRQSEAKRKIANLLEEGSTDVSTAKYKLSDTNKLQKYINSGAPLIEKDLKATQAIKQGFDKGVVAAVKGASPADKHQMLKMVGNMQRGKKNAKFAMANRPGDIVGDNLMKRFSVVRKANVESGKRLDEVAKSLKGRPVDPSDAINSYYDDLSDMGIRLDDKGISFKGSDIEGVAGAENILKKINSRINTADLSDAYEVHRLKRYIDENVSYGKSAEGLTGKSEGVIKKLRNGVDEMLDTNFPKYNKVNTKYAETINVLDDFQEVAGKKMDLTGPNADKAVGTLLRRLMSNVQSRVKLLDSIDNMEVIAKKYGGQFNDDIMTQALFADELDNVFKPVARTSFQGQIGQAVDRAIEGGTKSVAVSAAKKGVEKMRGINEDEAFKAIKDMLIK